MPSVLPNELFLQALKWDLRNLELNPFYWYQGINLIMKKKFLSPSSKARQKQVCIWQVEFVTASINWQGIRSQEHLNKSFRNTLGFGLVSGGFKGLQETGFVWIGCSQEAGIPVGSYWVLAAEKTRVISRLQRALASLRNLIIFMVYTIFFVFVGT